MSVSGCLISRIAAAEDNPCWAPSLCRTWKILLWIYDYVECRQFFFWFSPNLNFFFLRRKIFLSQVLFFLLVPKSSDVWPNWNNHWILPADTFVSVCPMLTRLVVNFWLCSCRMPSHCGAWQMAEFIYARHREHSVTSSYLFFVTLIEKRVVRNDCGKWRGVKCTRNAESNRME